MQYVYIFYLAYCIVVDTKIGVLEYSKSVVKKACKIFPILYFNLESSLSL